MTAAVSLSGNPRSWPSRTDAESSECSAAEFAKYWRAATEAILSTKTTASPTQVDELRSLSHEMARRMVSVAEEQRLFPEASERRSSDGGFGHDVWETSSFGRKSVSRRRPTTLEEAPGSNSAKEAVVGTTFQTQQKGAPLEELRRQRADLVSRRIVLEAECKRRRREVPEKVREEFQARMMEKGSGLQELRARLEAAEAAVAKSSVAGNAQTEELCRTIHERLKGVLAGLDTVNQRMEHATDRRNALQQISDLQNRQRVPALFSMKAKAADVFLDDREKNAFDALEDQIILAESENTEMISDAALCYLEQTCKRLRQSGEESGRDD